MVVASSIVATSQPSVFDQTLSLTLSYIEDFCREIVGLRPTAEQGGYRNGAKTFIWINSLRESSIVSESRLQCVATGNYRAPNKKKLSSLYLEGTSNKGTLVCAMVVIATFHFSCLWDMDLEVFHYY
jgi:hypothetical protein